MKAVEDKEQLLAELAATQANEARVNEQIMQVEQERKVSQMHNMSIMSHLSIDPAAIAQASMLQHHLDISHYASALGETTKINDDRQQIVQWHLNQIAAAKEEVEEAQR